MHNQYDLLQQFRAREKAGQCLGRITKRFRKTHLNRKQRERHNIILERTGV